MEAFITPQCLSGMRSRWILLGLAAVLATCATASPVPEPTTASFHVGAGPQAVAVADLNRDGKLDLAVACAGAGAVTILLGDGKGGYLEAKGSPFAAGSTPNDVAVADFDGDVRLDLAFANHDEKSLTVLAGDGRGGFRPAPGSPFACGSGPSQAAIGDVDGDGVGDVVVCDSAEADIRILFGGKTTNHR